MIRIGGASGYWGDSAMATPQLLNSGDLNYLVYDYLAEVTMSIMARARAKDADAGYARDFISTVLKQNLIQISRQKVKIISNAGGVNPVACGEAARSLITELGLDLKVAVVLGDDLIDQKENLAASEMFTGDAFPDATSLVSINAYLGAFPIARALDEGADIVITGRSVDSAVTLGACIHEFGWNRDDLDKLAGGTLAGHILECGTQVTGGNFTDWELAVDTIDTMGYPICEISPDGSFDVTKSAGTGGVVNTGTVSEQMIYEIGDPQGYIVPDVVCDFSGVSISAVAGDRVHVTGATGYPATDSYKVSATYSDGWRAGSHMTFYGVDAGRKAEGFAAAAFKRARTALRASNLGDYTETSTEVLGVESQFGDFGRAQDAREVVVKFAARHSDVAGINILLKEAAGLGLASPPGLSGFFGTRAKPSPVVRLFSFLIPKSDLAIEIDFGDRRIAYDASADQSASSIKPRRPELPSKPTADDEMVSVPLISLAWGRSGDKGNKANIGIIARQAEYLPWIWAVLNEDAVAARFSHFLEGTVERFYMPGPHAINFFLHDVLGGGGAASLRNDALGKGFAQILLDHPIPVPKRIAEGLS
ncbi:MAG: DUF1446 domain-containing protein [Alphaproteobacteria bacterium]|nr:DUF1446 domain-containing protein [Alphaproteobacteria bacterium]MBT4965610.1 DUF1446 domain-containing protein [Alphaproteobacteria bacterium]MBT5159480.1 DUF1446 domain-containing protein [Alphaproteobacteria bacterium]MBT6387062.1 DUF1446 domain-containing protein [Alphaproteobacteria bacterium]